MAHKTEHKFKIGDTVTMLYDDSIFGVVTSIWIKTDGVSYELGYAKSSGPAHEWVQECEIKLCKKSDFGFKGKR